MATAALGNEDTTLIKLAVAGDAECFAVLMNRHLSALKRCIGSMSRDPTDADDVLQDVLLKLWRSLPSFRSESTFRTWMTRVAINEVLQRYRRQKQSRLCQAFENLDSFPASDDSPHRSLVRRETAKKVRNAVAELPEIYRQVLVLRDFEQFSFQETAQSIGSSVACVKSRHLRARLMLSAILRGSRVRGLPAHA
jgi:RNA polymerase sigma-70 factor (ECF subfamily)